MKNYLMHYFTVTDDINLKDRWYLGDINIEDNWLFTYGKPLNTPDFDNLQVEIDKWGQELDFTLTDAYGVPIISEKLADQLFEFGDFIQLIPVSIARAKSNYYILVLKFSIDCVDEGKSEFEKFEEGNDIRPDKAGEYEVINVLKLDASRINAPIFRISKYDIQMVMSEEIKLKLEQSNITGCRFKLAT
jgi:hypothetical protein